MSIIYEPKGRAREYAPLAANLYSGCSHGCVYCYAPLALRRKRDVFHNQVKPRNNILNLLKKDAPKFSGKRVLLSFTTDPYQPCEVDLKITRQAIEILKEHNVFFEILTKGGMRASRDFDLYRKGDCFASTLTFTDEKQSLELEPFGDTPSNRIKAIKIAKNKGIETWASLEPVIDPVQSLALIERTHSFVDLFKVGTVNYHPNEIDWKRFANDAVNLLEKHNCNYYIKKDLKKFL